MQSAVFSYRGIYFMKFKAFLKLNQISTFLKIVCSTYHHVRVGSSSACADTLLLF